MDYQSSGVSIVSGDLASKLAYQNAKKTFSARDGLMGSPLQMDSGFSGALDFGDFLLVQNDDGVGTKMEIAEYTKNFSTIGQDLVAMVADDAICIGAETVTISNTIDTPAVDPSIIDQMTKGLAEACQREKIIVPGGEIAELGNALNKIVWNATAVGIVKKNRLIDGKKIQPGNFLVGLREPMMRSNGFSLARCIGEKYLGTRWYHANFENGKTWGDVLLTPSKIYNRLLLDHLIGDFENPKDHAILGIAHITGGGIPGNLARIFSEKNLGALIDEPHKPARAIKAMQEMAEIDEYECYRTWSCGNGMILVFATQSEAEKSCETLNQADKTVEAKIIGRTTDTPEIKIISGFSEKSLSFRREN